jgi:cytoskeletal protein CcmA (bactofilin family)
MALFSKDPTPTTVPRPPSRPGESQPAFQGTYFGPNVTVDGTVSGSEPVMVEGTIKGAINLTNDLRVGNKARIEAKVHARNVIVEGRLDGDISAEERVELVASATVDGNIKAPKIIVAEGAKFRGNVDMGSTKPGAQSEPGGKPRGNADSGSNKSAEPANRAK